MKELAQKSIQSAKDNFAWDGKCKSGYPQRILCTDPKWQVFFDTQYELLSGQPILGITS